MVASVTLGFCPILNSGVSIPFIAGQWSLPGNGAVGERAQITFQSPSLRGSGRFDIRRHPRARRPNVSIPFIAGQWSLRPRPVAVRSGVVNVSIPFIAGQWSLPRRGSARTSPRPGFNPLHCGAVVASSITKSRRWPGSGFQSPSLRGSGRFPTYRSLKPKRAESFNPLHCGAVVASRLRADSDQLKKGFQSPSLRGSGRFGRMTTSSPISPGFNPLHCGAVVASLRI